MIKKSFEYSNRRWDSKDRPPSYKQKQQSVQKTKKDIEDKGDSFINTRIPYLSPTTYEPIAFDSYLKFLGGKCFLESGFN
jgi:hypothetical protein